MKSRKIATFLMSAVLAGSMMMAPAYALEYNFSGDAPGQMFYQATTVGTNAVADSSTIVVGADGTISTDEATMPSNSPLSVLELPVGEYPDAWGKATDVAIAQNTIFPNALAPSTQWSNVPGVTIYDAPTVNSGALPTGAEEAKNAVYTGGTFGYYYYNNHIYNPITKVYTSFPSKATALVGMPQYNKNGAIGKLSIPAVGMNKYIYEGTGSSSLNKGIGHFPCSNGWDGNVALAGHNRPVSWAAFANLKNVNLGDLVYYSTAYGTRTYRVTSITDVSVNDTSGLLQDGSYKLTMYTCKANQPNVKLKVVATLVG